MPSPSNLGTARVVQADARNLPLDDNSVDLVVTSPPYWALRSYRDGGEHYAGQIGHEPTPGEYVDSLIAVTRECVRVLKPSGSLFVNLGDKYVTRSAGLAAATGQIDHARAGAREANPRRPPAYPVARDTHRPGALRDKSLIGIPWRYALRCIDDLGLILRAELVWSKPNGLPESVTDRVRRSHEQWFHFTLSPRYFSGVDEIREQYEPSTISRNRYAVNAHTPDAYTDTSRGVLRDSRPAGHEANPLGKLPGSVWTIATEPLVIPEPVAHAACCNGRAERNRAGKITCKKGLEHFAAFPLEWPKRIIEAWAPAGICVACGEGRRPVASGIVGYACACTPYTDHAATTSRRTPGGHPSSEWENPGGGLGNNPRNGRRREYHFDQWTPPATTRAVVLDPFGGTGTTATAAKALGRDGVTVDMSADYCRIAQWRVDDRDQLAKVLEVDKAPPVHIDDLSLLDLILE